MDTVARLSYALDEFAGICAAGHLTGPSVEAVTSEDSMTLRVSGSTWWDGTEYQVAVWVGDRAGTPGTADDVAAWLRVGDLTVALAEADEDALLGAVPVDALPEVVDAISQVRAMLDAGTDALECAETQYDLEATLEQLQRLAADAKSTVLCELEETIAHTDLMFNCMVDLLGNMSVTESQDIHLAFDVSADTLDPESGAPVRVRVCWAPREDAAHDYTHAFELGGARCSAHDDADFDRMLASYPEASREHYRHTFVHLHQAAHAVGEYAAAKVGQALAAESTVEDPLLLVERHEISHRVHAEVAAELNPFVREMSGAPGRGGEHVDGDRH